MTLTIRPELDADQAAIATVNRLAFGGPDEAALVDALRQGGYVRLSLVAEAAGELVGHILFSRLPIVRGDGTVVEALSLAPMAVHPDHQRRGIGSRLAREGLRACAERGHRIAVVLGHADFYPRFGFSAALAKPLKGPFSGEHWMAAELVPGALAGVEASVQYPPPFGNLVA